MHKAAKRLVERYYEALNNRDIDALLEMLSEDVIFDVNCGQREVGKQAFGRCVRQLSVSYQEHIFDIEIMTNDNGCRVAAEFMVLGICMDETDPGGEPPDLGQTYRLPGGAFFEVENGKIIRVSANYNPNTLLAGQQDHTSRSL